MRIPKKEKSRSCWRGSGPSGGGEDEQHATRHSQKRTETRRGRTRMVTMVCDDGGGDAVEVAGRRTKEKRRETIGGKSNEDTSSYPRRCGTMARSNLHQGWTSIHRPLGRTIHPYLSSPVMRGWIIIV